MPLAENAALIAETDETTCLLAATPHGRIASKLYIEFNSKSAAILRLAFPLKTKPNKNKTT